MVSSSLARHHPDSAYAAGLIGFALLWVNPFLSALVLALTLLGFRRAHRTVRLVAKVLLVVMVVRGVAFLVG
ncbi:MULTISPECIES: hypothetical protein [unclassified Aeromicrobium]|jgi:hypothetical protein|uniref:hypothetical protein n=1 Tax=unclassified Aeromicrobium TaxID=2633570 RepID=UPI000A6F518B|nr:MULTISPECIES: hypothetical protein [unclassified Aeromicrobium]